MQNEITNQFESIDATQLANVNGGGLFGAVLKLGEKALPLAKKVLPLAEKALPAIKTGVVNAAKWTGIPAAIGAGASWVHHEFTGHF